MASPSTHTFCEAPRITPLRDTARGGDKKQYRKAVYWRVVNDTSRAYLHHSHTNVRVPVQSAGDVAGARTDELIRTDTRVPPRESSSRFRALFGGHEINRFPSFFGVSSCVDVRFWCDSTCNKLGTKDTGLRSDSSVSTWRREVCRAGSGYRIR